MKKEKKTFLAKAETSSSSDLNDWGIPDWRDVAAYGDVSDWTLDRWRWEFGRRREDLRKCFDENAEAQHRANQALQNDPSIVVSTFDGSPDEPGFSVDHPDCLKLFGFFTLPNPRIGDQPANLIRTIDSFWHWNITDGSKPDSDERLGFQARSILDLAGIVLTKEQEANLQACLLDRFPVPLEDHELAITFNLNQPIAPQLAKAKKMLKSKQIERHGKSIQSRRHPTKWLNYLRSLDAREAGATWLEVASLHPETKQTEQTGRDKWQQARALCFNF